MKLFLLSLLTLTSLAMDKKAIELTVFVNGKLQVNKMIIRESQPALIADGYVGHEITIVVHGEEVHVTHSGKE